MNRLLKIPLKRLLNPKNWASVFRSFLIRKLIGGPDFFEEVAWRMKECKECVDLGYCPHCLCDMPAKALDPKAKCSQGKWGPSMGKYWKEFKKIKNI